jgi:hypothetical protein
MSSKTRFMKRAKVFLTLGILLSGFALTAFAQEEAKPAETTQWKKKPAIAFKLGAFFPSISAKFRVDAPAGAPGTEVDVNKDFGLAKTATTLRLDGDIPIAKWFSIDLAYYGNSRSKEQALSKDIVIGDKTYYLNQTVKTTLRNDFYTADFKFYLMNRQRLQFGVYAGINLAHFKLTFDLQEIDRQLQIKKVWAPVPSIGVHFAYTLLPHVYLYGKAGYFALKPGKRTKFQSGYASLNLDWYFYKFMGIGARYEYSALDLDIDVASYHGNIKYNIGGVNGYLTIGF